MLKKKKKKTLAHVLTLSPAQFPSRGKHLQRDWPSIWFLGEISYNPCHAISDRDGEFSAYGLFGDLAAYLSTMIHNIK